MPFSVRSARTRTLRLAGFALIMISSPVNGLRPLRAEVAGLLTVLSFIRPLKLNSPAPFLLRSAAIREVSASNTSRTLPVFRSVAAAICLMTSPRERRLLAGAGLNGFFFAVFAIVLNPYQVRKVPTSLDRVDEPDSAAPSRPPESQRRVV